MGLMAGMLPGVEFARRRRLRPVGSSVEAPCVGTSRRTSLGMYGSGNGHDHAHLGSAGFPKRSGVCEETWTAPLDSNAREAKKRLDQKLRSQRESVVKRRHSTGSLRLPVPSSSPRDRDAGNNHPHPAKDTPTAAGSALQREVFTKKGGGRRFSWGRRKASPPATEQAECAVCLEEFRAGDVLAHLPCSHRFHWACAVPWVLAASRCPFCRAAVRLASTNRAQRRRVGRVVYVQLQATADIQTRAGPGGAAWLLPWQRTGCLVSWSPSRPPGCRSADDALIAGVTRVRIECVVLVRGQTYVAKAGKAGTAMPVCSASEH